MNIVIGILCLFFAYSHIRVAVNPNRADRATVRWNAATLAILMIFMGLVFMGAIGPGPAQ